MSSEKMFGRLILGFEVRVAGPAFLPFDNPSGGIGSFQKPQPEGPTEAAKATRTEVTRIGLKEDDHCIRGFLGG